MMVHDVCWGGGGKGRRRLLIRGIKGSVRRVRRCPGAKQGVAGGQDMSVARTCLLYQHPRKTGYPLAVTTTIVSRPGDTRMGLLLYYLFCLFWSYEEVCDFASLLITLSLHEEKQAYCCCLFFNPGDTSRAYALTLTAWHGYKSRN